MNFIQSIALSTLVMSAISVAGEMNHEVDVQMKVEHGKSAVVLVNEDGKTTKVDIPFDALADKAQLETYLQAIPEPERQKIIEGLSKVNTVGDDFNWVSDENHTIVLDIDDEKMINGDTQVIVKEMMPKLHKKVLVLKSDPSHKVDIIKRLLKDGKFTSEQLNELQQVLDSKR